MSMRLGRTTALFLVAGGLATAASAQTDVITPASIATVNGTGGLNTIVRDAANPRSYQIMYAASELTGVIGQQLTAISWRSFQTQNTFPTAALTYSDYEIRVATGATSVATMSLTFAANLGPDVILVQDGPLTFPINNFPGLPGTSPFAFGGVVTFQTPFTYNGGDLVIDIRHPGATAGTSGFLDGLITTSTAQGYGTTTRAMSATTFTPVTGTAATAYVSKLHFEPGTAVTGACCKPDGSCSVATATGCAAAGGTYAGNNVTCAAANCPQPPTGACCYTDGQCVIKTSALCSSSGGTYNGNNSTCAAANCVQPGACCFSDGSCAIVTSARCTAASGVYHGNGSGCATAGCWTTPVLWNTAKVVTNPGAGFGGADASALPTGANSIGENQALTAGVRVADDFTIPAGENWTINRFTTLGYQTGSTTTSTFTQLVVRIWDRDPSDPAAVSLFGDITTNRINLTDTLFSNIYRVTTPLTDAQRPLIRLVADLPNVPLGPGHYFVEWAAAGSLASGPFIPLQTVGGPSFLPTGNAVVFRNAPWAPVTDIGFNTGQYPAGQPADLPFTLQGSRVVVPTCYANCDLSTSPPILNANDFQCFLNEFAAQTSYANCDASTSPPVLNANDFQCFLNAFAGGCS